MTANPTPPAHEPPWRPLMAGLYYPAALGAGFLAVVAKLAAAGGELLTEPALWLAVLLVVYFSSSFLSTHWAPANQYSVWLFLCDLGEAAALAVAFLGLGFLDLGEHSKQYPWAFEAALFFIFAEQVIWSRLFDPPGWPGWLVAVAAGPCLALAGLCLAGWAGGAEPVVGIGWGWVAFLVLVSVLYFAVIRKTQAVSRSG